MRRRTLILLAVPLTVLVGAAAFGFAAAGERKPAPEKPKTVGQRRALQEACASNRTYEGLKTQIFDEAAAIRGANGSRLDLLSGVTVVRMTDPLLKSQSDDLGVTVCSGHFVVELPPGAERDFGGRRRLEASIEYAAQPAADGSGLVYQLRGAEPIVYRLAAFGALPAMAAASPAPPLIDRLSEPVKVVEQAEPVVEDKPAPSPEEVKAALAPSKPKQQAKAKTTEKTASAPAKKAESKKAPAKAAKAIPEKKAPPKKVAAAKPASKKAEKKPTTKTAAAKKAPPVKKAAAKKASAPVKQTKAKPKPAPVKKAVAAAKSAPKPVKKAAAAKPKPAPVKKAVAAKRSPPKRVASANPCASKPTFAERLICGSAALATKDRRVTSLYISALDNADPETHAILRRTAGNFTAYRNGCRTEACLSTAYDDRAAEIRDIMADMR